MSIPNKRGQHSILEVSDDIPYGTAGVIHITGNYGGAGGQHNPIPGTEYGYFHYEYSNLVSSDYFRSQVIGFNREVKTDELFIKDLIKGNSSYRDFHFIPIAIADNSFIRTTAINLKLQSTMVHRLPNNMEYNKHIRHIGNNAFASSKIERATLNEVYNIGYGAFQYSNLSTDYGTNNNTLNLTKARMIGDYAFDSTKLGTVNMPAAKQVGSHAFSNVSSLTSVSMGKVERIGANAFYGARLNSIFLPGTLGTIENEAFRNAFDKSRSIRVTIPSSVTRIGEGAFRENPSITSISFQNTVSIPNYFAYGNTGLSSISLSSGITSIGNSAFNNTKLSYVDLYNVTSVGASAFENTISLTSVTANNVREVGNSAFKNTRLTTVSLPNATIIRENAFANNPNLTKVVIPKATTIEAGAFVNCPNLKTIELNGNVNITGASKVFHDNTVVTINRLREDNGKDANWQTWGNKSNIKYINSPYDIRREGNNVTITGVEAGKTLTPGNLTIRTTFSTTADGVTSSANYTVTKIGENAFNKTTPNNRAISGVDLTSVTIPNTITEIGEGAFANNDRLTNVTFNTTNLTEIKANTFKNTGLTSINLPNTVTTIGANAFENTQIKMLKLPKVTTINESAFINNSELQTVMLPEVTHIKSKAFSGNPKLNTVLVSKVENIEAGAFLNNPSLTNINLNGNVKFSAAANDPNNYKVFTDTTVVKINRLRDDDNKDANWVKWGNPTNIKYANSPFNYEKDNNTGQITLTGFETGKANALERNFAITEKFVIDKDNENRITKEEFTVTGIGASAFKDSNVSANTLTIPNSITEIGANAFENVGNNLQEIVVPNTITSLGEGAFSNNPNLTRVNIPSNNTLHKIENDTFKNTGLLTVSLPNTITEIGQSAFENTKIQGSVLLPNVNTLNDKAFANNMEITSIVAPNLETIKDKAFANESNQNTRLVSVVMPKINSIGEDAFINNANFKIASLATTRQKRSVSSEIKPNVMPNTLRTIKAGAFVGTGFKAMELNGLVEVVPGKNGKYQAFSGTTDVYINRVIDDNGSDKNSQNWGANNITYLDKPEFKTVFEANKDGTYKATITMTSDKNLTIDSVEKTINHDTITVDDPGVDIELRTNERLKQRTIVLDNIPFDKTTDISFTVKSLTKDVSDKQWTINKKIDYLFEDNKVAVQQISGRYYPDGFEVLMPQPDSIPTGKVFVGWSETKDASKQIYPYGTLINVNGNITLYALLSEKLPELGLDKPEIPPTTETKPNPGEENSTISTETSSEETSETTTQKEDKVETTTEFIKDEDLENIETTTNTVVTDKDGNIYDKDGNLIVDKNGNIYKNGKLIVDKGGYVYNKHENIIDKINTNTGNGNFTGIEDEELAILNNQQKNEKLNYSLKYIPEKSSENFLQSLNERGKQIAKRRSLEKPSFGFEAIGKISLVLLLLLILIVLFIIFIIKKKSSNDQKDLEI